MDEAAVLEVTARIQQILRSVGLLPGGGSDPTKTEAGAGGTALVDNALAVTTKAKSSIKIGTGLGAGGVTVASTAAWFMENELAVAFGVLALGVVAAAWGLGVAWVTQTDARARAAVATETMRSRGFVTQTLVELLLKPEASSPAKDADGSSDAVVLAAMLLSQRATVTTEGGKNGQVGPLSWRKGKGLGFQLVNGDSADLTIGDVQHVELHELSVHGGADRSQS